MKSKLCSLVVLIVASMAQVAQAFTVTSLTDFAAATANDGTLRGAVLAANASASAATIDFNVPSGGTITLSAGELVLTQSVTITGPTSMAITISGGNASRIFNIPSGITVNVAQLKLINGKAANGANGIDGVSPPSWIPATAGAAGANGGAILNAGTLTLTTCVISNCQAGNGGIGGTGYDDTRQTHVARGGDGGLGGAGGAGGAIFSTGSTTLLRSTIMNCSAGAGGLGGAGGWGTVYGGLGANGGAGGTAGAVRAVSGSLTLDTSTISLCSAGAGGNGGNAGTGIGGPTGGNGGNGGSAGAVSNGGAATISLVASTLANNLFGNGGAPGTDGFGVFFPAIAGSAGAARSLAGPAILRSSIVGTSNSGMGSPTSDISGTITSQGYNLISNIAGGSFTPTTGDIPSTPTQPPIAADPELGPIGNNGGPTPTCRVLSLSMALNSGDPSLSGTDQRGQPRSSGGVDKGAFELVFDSNANLAGLTCSAGSFIPTFSANTVNYVKTVANAVSSVTITPTLANLDASISLASGATLISGAASAPISLNIGANTIAINVTSADYSTFKTYTLTITRQAAPTLANWRQTHFGSSANTGNGADNADPDNDGIPNLLEWACGLAPTMSTTLPQDATRTANTLDYFYTRSVAAMSAGAVFSVQCSPSLGANDWQSSGITETVIADDGTTQQVRASIPVTSAACFARLRVQPPP